MDKNKNGVEPNLEIQITKKMLRKQNVA